MSRLRVALIQLAADQDVAANLDRAAALVRRAGESKPGLIALPEMFLYRGPVAGFRESATETARSADRAVRASWPASSAAGSCWAAWPSARPTRSGPTTRPSCWIRPAGLRPRTASATCSTWPSTAGRPIASRPGSRPATRSWWPSCAGMAEGADVRLGLSICFDLRFPELYRELAAGGGGRSWRCRPTSPRPPVATTGRCCCAPGPSRTGPSSSPRPSAASGRRSDPRPQHGRRSVGHRHRPGSGRAGHRGRGPGSRASGRRFAASCRLSRLADAADSAERRRQRRDRSADSRSGGAEPAVRQLVLGLGARFARRRRRRTKARR